MRVFKDLVAFIGDTPALNSTIDVVGHTGNAHCHLCRTRRQYSSVIGPKHAQFGECTSTELRRTLYLHAAVYDMSSSSEFLRNVGCKDQRNDSNCILLSYAFDVFRARHHTPRSLPNQSIPSPFFDPYRASLVAPGHLVTSLVCNCIAVALKLLPNFRYRALSESNIQKTLRLCRLPTQNKLLTEDTKIC